MIITIYQSIESNRKIFYIYIIFSFRLFSLNFFDVIDYNFNVNMYRLYFFTGDWLQMGKHILIVH